MFPLIARLIIPPLSFVACTVVVDEAACTLNGIKTKLRIKTVQTNVASKRNLFMRIRHPSFHRRYNYLGLALSGFSSKKRNNSKLFLYYNCY